MTDEEKRLKGLEYKRRYYLKNREAIKEKARLYKKAKGKKPYVKKSEKEVRERKKEYCRQYFLDNKEAIRERKRLYWIENRDRIKKEQLTARLKVEQERDKQELNDERISREGQTKRSNDSGDERGKRG